MTILVMGTIKLGAGEGAKAARLLADHAEAVRREDGCEEYGFAFDAADPDPGRAGRALNAMLTMSKLDVAALRAAADGVEVATA